jgi:uncharacterized HAD superfamily protein
MVKLNKGDTIAIDIDEVIVDLTNSVIDYFNLRYNANLVREKINDYDWSNVLDWPKKEVDDRITEFMSSPLSKNIPLVKGAKQGIETLSRDYNLISITSRKNKLKKQTYKLFKNDLDNIIKKDKIYFTNRSLDHSIENKKSMIALREGVKLIIEDQIYYAKECSDVGIHVFLFDSPWNRNFDNQTNITRVYSWNEIVDRLEIR